MGEEMLCYKITTNKGCGNSTVGTVPQQFGRWQYVQIAFFQTEFTNYLHIFDIIIVMAEKQSKYKQSRSFRKEEEIKKRSRKIRHARDESKLLAESKTPPLPACSSIEDLLQQRDTLKEELKKIAKHSESDLKLKQSNFSRTDNKKHSLYSKKINLRKRSKYETECELKKQTEIFKPNSPEYSVGPVDPLDSEDEETIIEQRRKQRKQLLEKYKSEAECDVFVHKEINAHKEEINRITDAYENGSKNSSSNTSFPPDKKTTDMFSEFDEPTKNEADKVTQDNNDNRAQLADNWDDAEGYYNIKIGDIINNHKYTIKSILGQGVFANVVRAQDKSHTTEVAIKIIRNNDLMYKTGLKEVSILKEIKNADPENRYHCVKFIDNFMHKGHLCIVLEPLYMDLRGVLKKYGKNHGINMKALMSYSRQLLLALRIIKKIGIIHADIKPDNILVNDKKNILKLCDFGSATKTNENEPTPYLVSRFYRAPEIILGVPYKYSVDIWSTACTVYEMCTGKIMFTGSSNNKMLKCFMDLKGKFPTKFIRKGKFKDQHFNYKNNFLLHKRDEFTGREKVVEIYSVNITRDLQVELNKACKQMPTEEDKKLAHLKDFLDKMLSLDPSQRCSVTECLKHPFIQEELNK